MLARHVADRRFLFFSTDGAFGCSPEKICSKLDSIKTAIVGCVGDWYVLSLSVPKIDLSVVPWWELLGASRRILDVWFHFPYFVNWSWSPVVAGFGAWFVNGWWRGVTKKVPSFIVTLGGYVAFSWHILVALTDGATVATNVQFVGYYWAKLHSVRLGDQCHCFVVFRVLLGFVFYHSPFKQDTKHGCR